jgi:flagella synthesis protein FlgN
MHAEMNAALEAVVVDMHGVVTALHDALVLEREALDASDVAGLDDAGHTKQTLLVRIESLEVERLQLSKAAQVDPSSGDVWPQILLSLAQCKQLNQVNGSIVNQRLAQVRQALSLLTGADQHGQTYGPGGYARAPLRSASLAQA